MKYYQVTAIWEEEFPEDDIIRTRDVVEEELRDSLAPMEFRNLRVDVIPLPSQPRREEAQVQIIPDAGVVHPWDEGKWIFPDDHPLAGYERAAKVNRVAKEKQAFLEAGQKMLPRGDE